MKLNRKERLEEHYSDNRTNYKLVLYTVISLVALYLLLDHFDVFSMIDLSEIKAFVETYRTEIDMYVKPIALGLLFIFSYRRARSWYKYKKSLDDY